MKALCEDSLVESITEENSVDLLLLADLHNAAKLKEYLLDYLTKCKVAQKKENLEKLKKNPDLLAELYVKSTN